MAETRLEKSASIVFHRQIQAIYGFIIVPTGFTLVLHVKISF